MIEGVPFTMTPTPNTQAACTTTEILLTVAQRITKPPQLIMTFYCQHIVISINVHIASVPFL